MDFLRVCAYKPPMSAQQAFNHCNCCMPFYLVVLDTVGKVGKDGGGKGFGDTGWLAALNTPNPPLLPTKSPALLLVICEIACKLAEHNISHAQFTDFPDYVLSMPDCIKYLHYTFSKVSLKQNTKAY